MKPRGKRGCLVPCRNGDLDAAGALGVDPGTFGDACSALLSTVRPRPAERKHRHVGHGGRLRPSKAAEARYRPFTVGKQPLRDLSHIADAAGGAIRADTPRPHDGSHEKAEAPFGPNSKAGAAGSGATASRTSKPGSAGFSFVSVPGARADQARQDGAAGGRGRASGADRPGCRAGHRLARDRRPPWGDQAGGPPALPAPPP